MRLYAALLMLDVAAILLGLGLAAMGLAHAAHGWPMLAITIVIYVSNAFQRGGYAPPALRSASRSTSAAVRALLFTYGTLFLIAYLLHLDQPPSRFALIIGMTATGAWIILFRQLLPPIVASRLNGRLAAELLIVDDVQLTLPDTARAVDVRQLGLSPNLADPMMLDRFARLVANRDRVIIACPPDRRQRWAMMMKGANIQGEILIDDFDTLGAVGVGRAAGYQTLTVSVGQLTLQDRATKRLLDLAVCVPTLIALAPLLIIVAIAIKLETPGPIFFKQQRVGRGNALFQILKFRSMRVEQCDADGKVSTMRDDKRITRVGNIIRKTSIDELPQLFNVLLGSMSIVGPRPHALGSRAGDRLFWEVDERYWHRHVLKPGITGLAQVRGHRGATHHRDDLTQRLQADLEYIDQWSLWRDISIMASTLRVLVHKNTY